MIIVCYSIPIMSPEAHPKNLFTTLRRGLSGVLGSFRHEAKISAADWGHRQNLTRKDGIVQGLITTLRKDDQSISPPERKRVEHVLIDRTLRIMYGPNPDEIAPIPPLKPQRQ